MAFIVCLFGLGLRLWNGTGQQGQAGQEPGPCGLASHKTGWPGVVVVVVTGHTFPPSILHPLIHLSQTVTGVGWCGRALVLEQLRKPCSGHFVTWHELLPQWW